MEAKIMGVKPSKENKAKYEITVETADGYFGAESSCWVHMEMTGAGGKTTGWIDLVEENDPTFHRGEIDVFHVEAENVGLPIIIRLGLRDHEKKDPWAVRYVNVKFDGEEVHFPVHDWIQDEMWVVRGEGVLSHKVNQPDVSAMLDREVERSKALLPWIQRPGPTGLARGLPRFVNALEFKQIPLIFRPTEIWTNTFMTDSTTESIKAALKILKETSVELTTLESYEILLGFFEKGKERSSHLDRWKSDEEFGRQQLNTISPLSIERCTKIPEQCQISGEHVNKLLQGKPLEKRMSEGKIYIVDYSEILNGAKRNKNSKGELLYCPEAFCLYFVNSEDNLVPVAIQLVPNDSATIFTPSDSADDWLLAKMYFKVAFGNMHEWYYHFLLTHGVMETFAVALFRGLPRSHPVYKLLRPHLQTVTIINSLARQTLIVSGSQTNKGLAIEGEDLARRGFKRFHMRDLHIPELLNRKGLDDEKLLPKFYYRDDATKLWEIMENFVCDIIFCYYHSDEDVICDKHLQAFVKDVAEEGLGWEDGDSRGVPSQLTTRVELIRLCTVIMFTSSGQHSAVNFPQYEMYKFVPNLPGAMRLPPHKKSEGNLQRMMDSLPDAEMSLIVVATTAGLSTYSSDEVYIGNYPVKLFVDPEAEKAIKKYKHALDKYAKQIKKRNEEVDHPYKWLLPEQVPNSIAI